MKIYVAGSFKNAEKIRNVAQRLREAGLTCYVFCDRGTETNTLSETLRVQHDTSLLKPNTALQLPIVRKIGCVNFEALKTCQAAIMILPCGNSAHIEAGYMVGRGLPMWIYGPMTRGEFDAMYVMAKGVFDEHEFKELVDEVIHYTIHG